MESVRFLPGPVEATIPEQMPERISLLRSKTGGCDSTRCQLEQPPPPLSPRGLQIVDDNGAYLALPLASIELIPRAAY